MSRKYGFSFSNACSDSLRKVVILPPNTDKIGNAPSTSLSSKT